MADAVALKVGNRRLSISNPAKVFYNAGKFTKLDVVDYYQRVAPFLLPHFRDRPVTLKRYPNGIHGEVFYEKDAPAYTPDWIQTFPVPRREAGPDINYIVINDRATLACTANIAALELHPFLHRVPRLDLPTHVVFDLDPGEGADLHDCIEVAFLLEDVLKKLRLKSFPKVSGSKGLQVSVPTQIQGDRRSPLNMRRQLPPGRKRAVWKAPLLGARLTFETAGCCNVRQCKPQAANQTAERSRASRTGCGTAFFKLSS